MAFPSKGHLPSLASVVSDAQDDMGRIKDRVQRAKADMAGGANSQTLLNLHADLVKAHTRLTSYRAVPGLAAYAREAFNDAGFDAAKEFNGVLTALATAVTWIEGAVPKDGNGYLLLNKIEGGKVTNRQFGAGAVAQLMPYLDAIDASIA